MVVIDVAKAAEALSQLLDRACDGEEILLARAGHPLVRLVPVEGPAPRELGFVPSSVPDDVFDPLDEDELSAWE